jgi:hypothetical protein
LPKALTPVPSVAPPSDEPAVAAAETAAKAGSPLDAGAVDSQLSKEVENGKAKSADAEGKGLSPIAPAASAVKVEEKEEGEVDEDGKDVEMKGWLLFMSRCSPVLYAMLPWQVIFASRRDSIDNLDVCLSWTEDIATPRFDLSRGKTSHPIGWTRREITEREDMKIKESRDGQRRTEEIREKTKRRTVSKHSKKRNDVNMHERG